MKHSLLTVILIVLAPTTLRAQADIVFADFEASAYGPGWKTTGTAFGNGPARGTQPGQMAATGFLGKGLVNSFLGGDRATGTLTSPAFRIERKSIHFLVGGGGHPGQTCINLIIDGKAVRSATGPNTRPGGSERLEPAGWDVGEHLGKTATIEIVDQATGGWGHVNIDHIVFTDRSPPAMATDATRELVAASRFLMFPVKTGSAKRKLTVSVDGKAERWFDIELADAKPDWWAPLDISAWKGKTLALKVERLPSDSQGLGMVQQGETLKADDLYREPLRPQFHFSPRSGWTNDPNGLVFFRGEYHLLFQHNPYGWAWGNMHWGHAVSKDLVHWTEIGEALYPDAMGPVFSGSAVVDWKNTSGLGENALVLCFTAAGNPAVQCLAYSHDGRTFHRYADNPVLKQITPGNRDPKVFWHEPTKRWVMALYVGKDKKHFIHLLTSPDLKTWTDRSQIEGFYECPDLFELPLDGDAAKPHWVLTAASSEYMIGTFDGITFTPQTTKLPGHRGKGFYAAQTFSDVPNRRIQIGWLQAPSPGMPFNQAMSVPLELKLVTTTEGPRLTWTPIRELDTLRGKSIMLKVGEQASSGELLDIVAELRSEVRLTVRGVPVAYDATKQVLAVNGHRVPVPLREGKLDLRILVDRTAFEVFADRGRTYIPMPVIAKAENRSVSLVAEGEVKVEVHAIRSIWPRQ